MKGKEIINYIIRAEMPDVEKVREKCVQQATNRTVKRRNVWIARMVPSAVCAVAVIAAILVINRNGWPIIQPAPSDISSPTQTESTNPLNTQTSPSVPVNPPDSAVCHDVPISTLIRSGVSGKVPFDFWFSNKLMLFAKNETDINLNNGVRWDEQVNFTNKDIGTTLDISVYDPILPSGDYTTAQSVLVDEATNKIIAYQTIYYFFNKDTMEFQHSFKVFYLATNDFKPDSLTQSDNIVLVDGIVHINDFTPVSNAYGKIPHVRYLVYLNNGISIVIEAETDAILTEGKVNEAKSLEKYEQVDKKLVSMMESLIK